MSYCLVVFFRKINSLCFTINIFLSIATEHKGGGSFACIYSFQSSHQRHSFKKSVLKNFAKFLRTPFYRTPPNSCFFPSWHAIFWECFLSVSSVSSWKNCFVLKVYDLIITNVDPWANSSNHEVMFPECSRNIP